MALPIRHYDVADERVFSVLNSDPKPSGRRQRKNESEPET